MLCFKAQFFLFNEDVPARTRLKHERRNGFESGISGGVEHDRAAEGVDGGEVLGEGFHLINKRIGSVPQEMFY